MKKKEYYSEELEKKSSEKMRVLKYQKYYGLVQKINITDGC